MRKPRFILYMLTKYFSGSIFLLVCFAIFISQEAIVTSGKLAMTCLNNESFISYEL